MGTFELATAIEGEGERYRGAIDPEWFIWGPVGGYLAAIAMRAMGAASTRRRPATFSCQFLRVGAAGPVEVVVGRRKSGRRAECMQASVIQAGKPLVEAQSWIVADDLTGLQHDHARMPHVGAASDSPPWDGVRDGLRDDESLNPIWTHIERRLPKRLEAAGSDQPAPEWSCWMRLARPIATDDLMLQAALVILWMDMAPWNAALATHGWPTTHIAPTLDLTVQFQPDFYGLTANPSEWLLVETRSPNAGAGLFGGHGMLWSQTGRLLAVGAAQSLCVTNSRFAEQKARAKQAART